MNRYVKVFLILCFVVGLQNYVKSQGLVIHENGVGISQDSTFIPDPSAILDISSDDHGVLIPRMDSVAVFNIQNPADGLLAYDTVNHCIWQYRDSNWYKIDNLWSKSSTGIYTENNVGIGISNPEYAIDCDGDINLSDGSSYRIDGQKILSAPGTGNIFAGLNAGQAFTTGQNNTSIGENAGYSLSTGSNNTTLGNSASYLLSSGSGNLSIGYTAAYNNNGSNNTVIGSRAGYYNTTGGGNALLGYEAGFGTAGNCTGSYNLVLGYQSGRTITSGVYNVFGGFKAGYSSTSGNYNVFLGAQSGYLSTNTYYNVFIGYYAGYSTTNQNSSVYIGTYAGRYFNAGNNVYMGTYSGNGVSGSSTGTYNCFLGYQSGYVATTASNNTIIGFRAGYLQSSGNYNVFIGNEAGYRGYDSDYNVMIGFQSGYGSASGHPGDKNVFIGYQSGYYEYGSDKLYIENTAADSSNALIYGDFSNDLVMLNADVVVRDYFTIDAESQLSLSSGSSMAPEKSYAIIGTPSSAITLNTTTAIEDGSYVGQVLILEGSNDTRTITINDGANTKMAGNVTLGLGDTIMFIWNGEDWMECGRSNN